MGKGWTSSYLYKGHEVLTLDIPGRLENQAVRKFPYVQYTEPRRGSKYRVVLLNGHIKIWLSPGLKLNTTNF